MDLREVECFLAVADHLHFGKAADALHLTQPTVSEAVRRLEREIGGVLFERTTRSVALTPLGTTVLPGFRSAYAGIEDAFEQGRRAASRDAAQLRVGFTADSRDAFMPIIGSLRAHAPSTVPRFQEMFSLDQMAALESGALDVAVCWTRPAEDAPLRSEVISSSGYVALLAPDDALAGRERIVPADLAGRTLIALPYSLNPTLIGLITGAFERDGVDVTLTDDEISYENMAARVLAGEGVGIALATAALALRLDTIAYVPLAREHLIAQRHLVWRGALGSDVEAALVDAASTIRGLQRGPFGDG